MPAGAMRRSVPSEPRPRRLPGPCAPTPARDVSGRFAAPTPRPRSGVYGEAVPALTRFVDADPPVSSRAVSGMRARDEVPRVPGSRGAAALVVRRLALVRVDGPVSSRAVPTSAVRLPRPAPAPRPPVLADLRCCGVPRLACVAPPVPRPPPDADDDARSALADRVALERAPLPPPDARCVPRDEAAPRPSVPFEFESVDARSAPVVRALDAAAPAPRLTALVDALRPDSLPRPETFEFDAAPLAGEAEREAEPLREPAAVPLRSDALLRAADEAPVADRDAAAEARVEPAPVAWVARFPDVAGPFEAADLEALFFGLGVFAGADFEVEAPDAAPVIAPFAFVRVPLDFVPAPAVFAAPLPRDVAAPLPFARVGDDRVDAEDFFTAVPREAACSLSPSALRAFFERPACLPIAVPACAAPGPVRPPAVVAMGMLRSNVAPAGASPS